MWRRLPCNCDSTVTIAILPFKNGVTLPIKRCSVIAALVASLALAACATTPSAEPPAASATPAAAAAAAPAATPASQLRDLTPQEKKIIVDAIAPSLREPGSAKYKWAKFPMVPPSDQVSYCATVDAKSPFAAYSGHQSYIVDTKVVGGHITAAVLGLIAGGKDAKIVAGMCANHGLDPNSAT
jgi:hypothetical protein